MKVDECWFLYFIMWIKAVLIFKIYALLNRSNSCQTVCFTCNVLSPVYSFLQGFTIACITFKKAASLGKITSHPYDKVLRLSPEENPILTGVKCRFTMILKRAQINRDWLKKKLRKSCIKMRVAHLNFLYIFIISKNCLLIKHYLRFI